MEHNNIIKKVNLAWNWTEFTAVKILMINKFGNIIFQTSNNEYCRICPEELSCEVIANSELEYIQLCNDSEFEADWNMDNLIRIAKQELGELGENQKYCLKIPAIIGGKYSKENLGKISFDELISFSGDLAFQIKDLEDGQEIELKIKN